MCKNKQTVSNVNFENDFCTFSYVRFYIRKSMFYDFQRKLRAYISVHFHTGKLILRVPLTYEFFHILLIGILITFRDNIGFDI